MSAPRWPVGIPSTPEWNVLGQALLESTAPCVGRDEWTSEDPAARAVAAVACTGCPLVVMCGAAAESTDERFGIWAGIDRSPTKTKRARKSA